MHLNNRNKSYNRCETFGEAFRCKFWQKSAFWNADLQEKNKSIEASRSMKYTHNLDQDMLKIIDEGKFI